MLLLSYQGESSVSGGLDFIRALRTHHQLFHRGTHAVAVVWWGGGGGVWGWGRGGRGGELGGGIKGRGEGEELRVVGGWVKEVRLGGRECVLWNMPGERVCQSDKG